MTQLEFRSLALAESSAFVSQCSTNCSIRAHIQIPCFLSTAGPLLSKTAILPYEASGIWARESLGGGGVFSPSINISVSVQLAR